MGFESIFNLSYVCTSTIFKQPDLKSESHPFNGAPWEMQIRESIMLDVKQWPNPGVHVPDKTHPRVLEAADKERKRTKWLGEPGTVQLSLLFDKHIRKRFKKNLLLKLIGVT